MTNPQGALAPFSCRYSPQIPELLLRLNCSIAISTYQAGKLIFLSPKDENSLIQLPRHFEKAMGIAIDEKDDRLAIACKNEVIVFKNSRELAAHYPKAPNKYDALYMPRLTYHTGPLDIHDLSFGSEGKLFAVNTLFSCLIEIDGEYNFRPIWKPEFISEISSEDRCHLNGMAMENGNPRYVTAFNKGNTHQSWRENVTTTGIVIDTQNHKILAEGLAMPHSPRIFNNELYVLQSASGELTRIDRKTGELTTVIKIDGFVRGMDLYQDYLFIGMSKLRKNSSTFAKLPFKQNVQQAGIMVVHLPTGSIAGEIKYLSSLDEIYDVHILKGKKRPNIMNTLKDDHYLGLTTPENNYWARPTIEKQKS